MTLVANLVVVLVLAGTIFGGVALFWIARQDDSHLGRDLGLAAVAVGIAVILYLTLGQHWL